MGFSAEYKSFLRMRSGLLALAFGVVFAVTLAPRGADAARLFTSGFETNNFTGTEWSGTLGSPTIQAATVRSGSYAGRTNASGQAHQIQRLISPPKTSGTIWVRFYARFPAAPSVTTLIFQDDSNTNALSRIQIQSDRKILLQNFDTSSSTLSSSALSADTWYRFEFRHLIADVGGELELRIYASDGTTALETLSLPPGDTLPGDIERFLFGVLLNDTFDIFFDDIAMNDDTGTFQNSWPGPGRVVLVKPTFDKSVEFTPTPAGSNAANVDDVPGTPDDDTTYNVVPNCTTCIDRFYLSDLPTLMPPTATLTLAHVAARGSCGSSCGSSINLLWWDEASATIVGPIFALVAAYEFPETNESLVVNLSTSTPNYVSRSHIGYKPVATREKRVTALWANVEYQGEIPGGAEVTSRSDILNDSRPSQGSNHTITFTTQSAVMASSTMEIRFPGDFSFPSGLDCGDVDVATSVEFVLSATSVGCEVTATLWGISFAPSPPTLIITSPTSSGSYISTGTVVTIRVGTNATSQQTGTTQITNPATAGVYTISVGGTFGGSGNMLVSILSGVTVEARVAEHLTVSVSSVQAATCTADDAASITMVTSTATSVPFGTVSANTFYQGCQDIEVSTNAGGGYVATVQEESKLKTGSGSAISDTTCDPGTCTESTAAAWTNASNSGFGFTCRNQTNNDCVAAFSNGTNFRQFADISAGETAQNFMTSSTPVRVATGRVKYRLSVPSSQAAGTYTTKITYIITPTY